MFWEFQAIADCQLVSNVNTSFLVLYDADMSSINMPYRREDASCGQIIN